MHSLVNISEGTSLAIHGLGLMAERAPERLNVRQAAAELEASEAHLAKVFGKLQKSGLVESVRGPAGGFTLARKAEDISFFEVYEIFEAPTNPEECPMGRRHCPFGSCFLGGRLHKVVRGLLDVMTSTSIADLGNSITRPNPSHSQ
ncbi:MAG: Rrf2 family transcriptional regulator [Spirochaetales bacterium]|nr:Rrf2 family transcriptional regulator [Spirochaetales bacterium]